ncbi:double-strand break repair protein AddB [Palleronia sp. LCG004]|uniref:double-strand break repair protein AddB n=1 Tax=Palleronia sp. LCG004 TaxID=3079304 RepID=UPI002942DACD|nr:double-strand break repair protein AddB [Palleronia sp. LCG004]WOI55925.1 double-strand break repair protein AddB [Palleronia sp. LCG004]
MFDADPTPRLFGLPPGADFPAELVRGIEARLGDAAPEDWARVELYVNTSRTARRLSAIFGAGPPRLLPRVRLLSALGTDPLLTDLPPPADPLGRRLELTQLTAALIRADPDLAGQSAAFDLADSLATLIDEMQGEGVPLGAITGLDVTDQSGHWQRALRFLSLLEGFLAADTTPDPEARQRRVVEALIEKWQIAPPAHPVIVAGSTGSRGTTALLMRAVAQLPQGAVILPGVDPDMPREIWDAMGDALSAEDHPQYRFVRIARDLDLHPGDIRPWTDADPDPQRRRLVSMALRPAPVTDGWLRDGPALGDLVEAAANVSLLEAPDPRIEALAIAIRLRAALDEGKVAALISPDRVLTRQVTAALDRWGIEPDDSAGRPLALSVPGRLLRHMAARLGTPSAPEDLLTILKHPLTHTGTDRGPHLRLTHELELWLRRDGPPHPTPEDLHGWASRSGIEGAEEWVAWIEATILAAALLRDGALSDIVARHLSLTEALAGGPAGGSGELWLERAGEKAAEVMSGLGDQADAAGAFTLTDYRALLDAILDTDVRDPIRPDPRVMIWGTLEARVQGADLVILGGLNEGVWPEAPKADPWLNRRMRAEAGLLLPERRIGLSAHDFQQAVCAPEVLITRAARNAEAETVMSRWLNRLTNLMAGLEATGGRTALDEMRARGRVWLTHAETLEARILPSPPERRPAPCPPVHMRPRELSVTDIQRLVRDPYAIYARRILNLSPLDSLRKDPDAALRGTLIHSVFERYVEEGIDPAAPNAADALMRLAEEELIRDVPWRATRIAWLARLERVVPWFLDQDAAHRATAMPEAQERRARLEVAGTGVTIVGKADRIDRATDGGLVLLDYKTGAAPTARQIRQYDPQLLIEAVMAEAGTFEGLPAARVAQVGHVELGSTPRWRSHPLRDPAAEVPLSPEEALAMLTKLLSAYGDEGQGYASRRAMEKMAYEHGYDHLARFGEWDISERPEKVVLR